MSANSSNIVPKTTFPIMESFYTIQGEGFHQGKAAWFVRFAGCDVGCVWCDVKESWESEPYKKLEIEEILDPIKNNKSEIVVITGGEPLMYNLEEFTAQTKCLNKKIHIETSGAYHLTGKWDWITFSPKKFKAPKPEFYDFANELKVVIFNKTDFEFAEKHAKLVNNNCKLFLQPEWSKEKEILPLIINYVKQNPQWQISLQTHKYLNVR